MMLTTTFFMGFSNATGTLSAQSMGAGNHKLAGLWLQSGLLLITITVVPIGISWWYLGDILRSAGFVDDHLCDLANEFSRWMCIKLLPDAAVGCVHQWLIAQEIVKPITIINLLALLSNAGFNVLLVFGISVGSLQWKGLGFIGSPIATSLTCILKLLMTLAWMRCQEWRTWHGWDLRDACAEGRSRAAA